MSPLDAILCVNYAAWTDQLDNPHALARLSSAHPVTMPWIMAVPFTIVLCHKVVRGKLESSAVDMVKSVDIITVGRRLDTQELPRQKGRRQHRH